jgi:hypothetical protein
MAYYVFQVSTPLVTAAKVQSVEAPITAAAVVFTFTYQDS